MEMYRQLLWSSFLITKSTVITITISEYIIIIITVMTLMTKMKMKIVIPTGPRSLKMTTILMKMTITDQKFSNSRRKLSQMMRAPNLHWRGVFYQECSLINLIKRSQRRRTWMPRMAMIDILHMMMTPQVYAQRLRVEEMVDITTCIIDPMHHLLHLTYYLLH